MTQQKQYSVLPIHIGIALGYFGNYIYMPHLISTIGKQYSGTLAGFIIFLTFLGRLLSSLVSGGLSEKYGRKFILVTTVLLEAFALFAYGLTTNIVLLSCLATIVGIASGLSFPALKATLSELPVAKRADAFSKFILAQKIGTIAGAIAGMLFDKVNMSVIFTFVFLVFLGYAISIGKFLHISPEGSQKNPQTKIIHWQNPKDWEIWNVAGLFVTYTFFWFLYSQFLVGMPLHIAWLAKPLPVTTPFWITGLTMLVLQVFLYKTFRKYLKEAQLMVTGMGFFIFSFLLLGLGQTASWVVIAAVLFVIAEMLFIPAFDVWLASRPASKNTDRAMGTQHFFRSAGNMAGTCSAGVAYDLSRNYNRPGLNWILFAGIALGCMLFIYIKMLRPKKAEKAKSHQKECLTGVIS